MTRTAFLAALEQLLAPLPEAERKDALSYYEDYLDAAGPENEARAIAELGSPEEVARKILDEQTPADSSAAPASPVRKPRSRWRMVLGGGLAVLVLACFFFQHSKATPVQPVEPASPAADSSSVPEEASSSYLAVLADTVPLTIPAHLVELLDDAALSLQELARGCAMSPDWVHTHVEAGVLQPGLPRKAENGSAPRRLAQRQRLPAAARPNPGYRPSSAVSAPRPTRRPMPWARFAG